MKKKFLFFLVLPVLSVLAFKKPADKTINNIPAAPAVQVVEVQPPDGCNNFYYMICAAKTSADKPTA